MHVSCDVFNLLLYSAVYRLSLDFFRQMTGERQDVQRPQYSSSNVAFTHSVPALYGRVPLSEQEIEVINVSTHTQTIIHDLNTSLCVVIHIPTRAFHLTSIMHYTLPIYSPSVSMYMYVSNKCVQSYTYLCLHITYLHVNIAHIFP